MEYNPLEAAAVAHAHLPTELRQHLTLEDVFYMLYQEFKYHEAVDTTATTSAASDGAQAESIVAYITGVAQQEGRFYSAEQVAYVLRGEDIYLRQIGLLHP